MNSFTTLRIGSGSSINGPQGKWRMEKKNGKDDKQTDKAVVWEDWSCDILSL